MIRAYEFLMRPTVGQTIALGEMLRDHCGLCNGALQERRDAYRHISRTSIKYGMQKAVAPKPDPGNEDAFLPNGAAAKSGLNRSISDAGWGCSSRSSPARLKAPAGQ